MNHVMRFCPLLLAWAVCLPARAEYTETMNPNGLTKNLRDDYGLVDDNGRTDQSARFQRAIDQVAAAGGGRLIVPKGVYQLAGIYLKSNVHLLFEQGTVVRPHWPPRCENRRLSP